MIFGKYVNKYYLKYAIFYILGVAALIFVDYIQLEIPEVCKNILNGVQDGTLLDDPSPMPGYIIKLAIIALSMFVCRFGWRYCVIGTAAKIEGDLREDMFNHSLTLSNQYYKEHKTGALMALFTNDLQTLRRCFGFGIVMLADAIFLGIFALVKMIMCNWILTLFSVIPMALVAIIAVFVGRVMERKFKERQEAYDHLSDFAQENFSGIAVVKAFVKEVFEIRFFDKVNKENYDKNISFVKFSTLLDVLLTTAIMLIFSILFGGGAYFVVNGFFGNQFTAGDLWAFTAYFDAAIWPFMAVAQLINMKAQGKASYKRVKEFMDVKPDIVDNAIVDVDSLTGKIEFNHLNFMYPDGSRNCLEDISFTINAGEMVGIIGKTGCGKTTVVDLLLRTYNVEDNQILLDDTDIMHIPYKKVRDSIGYVPQDNFLFSDTIANNIAFSFADANEEEIENAAALADVDKNIKEFTDKYQTVLGERGVTLSGGQKQRVSIARALIKKPSILIFDDSVSAVDTKTEEAILTNLRQVRKGLTTIMIAHRISTVKTLDKIIVMDEGKVIGVGNNDELMANCPQYKEMVRLQSLESEVNGGEL